MVGIDRNRHDDHPVPWLVGYFVDAEQSKRFASRLSVQIGHVDSRAGQEAGQRLVSFPHDPDDARLRPRQAQGADQTGGENLVAQGVCL
jgi:hypothetical protein